MVEITLLTGALSLCLLASAPTPCVGPPYESTYDALAAHPSDPVPQSRAVPFMDRAAAWREAIGLLAKQNMEPPKGWIPPEARRVRVSYMVETQQLLGVYQSAPIFTKAGRMVIEEQVIVFLKERDGCHQHAILVHEYLHALHRRLNHVNPKYRGVDPEAFVARFYPIPEVLPACPATP